MTNSILFVDAYDSFSRNIISLLHNCITDVDVVTVKIDTDIQQEYGIDLEPFFSSFEAIVLGPGPGDPRNNADVGLFRNIWDIATRHEIPVLGICLGFQSLCLQYGLSVVRLDRPCHGQTKSIKSNMLDIFEDVFNVVSTNYNSLGVKTSEWSIEERCHSSVGTGADSGYSSDSSTRHNLAQSDKKQEHYLKLLAWDDEGYTMAVKHMSLPFWGLQFHPESCMSNDSCHKLIRNWWAKTVSHDVVQRYPIQPLDLLRSSSDMQSSQNHVSSSKAAQNHGTNPRWVGSCDRNRPAARWTLLANSGLTMDDLSSLCHDLNSTNTIVMLESSAKGRFCIYAFPHQYPQTVSYINGQLIFSNGNSVTSTHSVPPLEALQGLEETTKPYSVNDGNPDVPFWGGYVGYISYEMCLDILHNTSTQKSATSQRIVPDFSFIFVERSLVLDKETGNIYIQSIMENDRTWIDTTHARLLELGSLQTQNGSPRPLEELERALSSITVKLPSQSTYTSQIETCKSHLHAGNSYELCLTTEAVVTAPIESPETPYLLYRNLNKHNPVPFASYLHFPSLTGHSTSQYTPSTTILSTSPEQFLSWSRNGTLDMVPMKGTVPRRTPSSPTLSEATTILRNVKESAENLMIADLIRHDLHGIVGCKPYHVSSPSQSSSQPQSSNSPVRIVKLNEITPYATVYQLTSHIRAHPPPTLHSNDTKGVITHNHSSLHHTLPPGSMTGAPKRRSCQILSDIEQRNRGVYSGVIGYMDVGGGGCWSVAIRTAWSSSVEDFEGSSEEGNGDVRKFKKWHIGAGGAVTVLSDVQGEWEEMMAKLGSVLRGFRS